MIKHPLPEFDTDTAFEYYQSISHRLPSVPEKIGQQRIKAQTATDLLAIADNFDVFVFDAFGVLNVGHTAIAGAHDCIEALRNLGKQLYVLTNGASAPLSAMPDKFAKFGFEFSESEIVSSRYCAEEAVNRIHATTPEITQWGIITGGLSSAKDVNVPAVTLDDPEADLDSVDAILFLSASTWSASAQAALSASLKKKPRLLVVANPDVIAPKEDAFSLEPGYFSHELINDHDLPFEFHGKPFPSVFDEIERRCQDGIASKRIAMIGDSLHTDVLGARVRGWSSVLVSDHGMFRGCSLDRYITESGIDPDWIVPSI